MKSVLKSRQSGAVIMEALIAFLVLGIGVAALLYLQGDLMSGSSLSKARAEAVELAKDRMEVLRNYTEKNQYLSSLSGVQQNEQVDGVNATFTVNYTIRQKDNAVPPVLSDIHATTNPLTTDKVQSLMVKVNWTGSEGNSEEVTVGTMLYFMNPTIAVAISSDNDGVTPFPLLSPFITGEEGQHPSTVEFDDSETIPDVLLDAAGDTHTTLQIKTYYKTDTGEIGGTRVSSGNVEVIDAFGNVRLTSFGGIVHKLQGEIIINSGANTTLGDLTEDLKILASPPSYCVFPICEGDSCAGKSEARYVCYVPGDCTYQDLYSSGNLNGCPPGFIPPADDDFPDLNGGWYGRVGNFGIAIHPDDKVCTFQTDETSTTVLTPSRNYVRYRWGCVDDTGEQLPGVDETTCVFTTGNEWMIISNEGINTPYDNQSFMITRKNTDCDDVAIDDFEPDVLLVSSQIEGPLLKGRKIFDNDGPAGDWDKNFVLPENSCNVYVGDPPIHDPSCPY